MQAINRVFTDIINGNRQFIIPVFQRDYCWTRKQCEQFWRDVTNTTGSHSLHTHFMGSFVYIAAGPSVAVFQRWLLIDGQQRLTTLTLLLIALRDHIREASWSGDEDGPTAKKTDDLFLRNIHESGDRQYKLVLRRKDNDTLHALVDGRDLTQSDSKHSELILEAYMFFRSELERPSCDPAAVFRGIASLNIVDVALERGVDNPQLVFESMNSTGIDLRQSDLVRNYLLMELDEKDQTRLYDEYWSKIESFYRTSENALDWFLRDYMALEQKLTQPIRLDRVYEEFKVFWNTNSQTTIEKLLVDMTRVSRTYASFLGIAEMKRPWLADAMRHMRSLSTTQGLVIMRLYDFHDKGQLSQDEFIRAVELIESYLLRRSVLGLQTRGYWSVFARISLELNPESAFESLQVAFARLRGHVRFPNDEEFRRGLLDHDLYGLRVCKHLLDRLENAGHAEPSPVHNYSIEHIMPQEISESSEWQEMLGENWAEIHETQLHRLGNLTLTAYNSRYSNRPFEMKKTIEGGFQQSAVRLNRDVAESDAWTATEIRQRGSRLASRALEIWGHHGANAESIQAAEIRDLKRRAAILDASDLEMEDSIRKLLDNIRQSIGNLGCVIEVVERRSVCCYGPQFFAELLPRPTVCRIILPLEFSEIEKPPELTVYDTSTWKFVPNRVHTDCDVVIDVARMEHVPAALSLVRQAWDQSRQ